MENTLGNGPASSGYVGTKQAARALGVDPRTVRNMIDRGELEGVLEGEGVNRRYFIPITSLDRVLIERQDSGNGDLETPGVSDDEKDTGTLGKDAAKAIESLSYRLGRAESRLELTEQTESTLRGALEREREALARERSRVDELEAALKKAHQSWWHRLFGR